MIKYNSILSGADQTVADLIANKKFDSSFGVSDFLDYKRDLEDSSNLDRIFRPYEASETIANQQLVDEERLSEVVVKAGTTLYIPNSMELREVLSQVPPEQFATTEFKPFMASALADLLRDPTYTTELSDAKGRSVGRVISNEVTVLMWVRALSKFGDNTQSGRWVNVSSFVEHVNIVSGGAGGTFMLGMSPVVCTSSKLDGWQFESRVRSGGGNDLLVAESLLKTNQATGDYMRNDFLFHTAVQQNDLVLIKLERLGLEKGRPIDIDDTSAADVVGADKCYDMIGLVDLTRSDMQPGNVNIIIQGRDLTKILIDDSSIFFPEQFAQNIFSSDGVLAKRNRLELELQTVSAGLYQFKTIDTILKFIFNKFSNIGYVPDQVFRLWGDRSTKTKYSLTGSQVTSPEEKSSSVKDRVLSVTKSQSSQVYLSQASERFLDEERRGVWRICELVIDPQVKKRVLVDNNVNNDAGSILNTINKICQNPFVQFYTDTYGDRFYLIARPAPFDESGVKGMLYDSIETELDNSAPNPTDAAKRKLGKVVNKVQLPLRTQLTSGLQVIEIDGSQVLSDQLTFHNEVYSWYRIVPRGLGLDDQALFALTPIITLDEYGEVFGSRPMSVEYNYCPAEFVYGSRFKDDVGYVEGQVFRDLKFLVDSNQYLPFTRRGTITLDGDRRIKKGTYIRYNLTGEVFYVESVVNTRSLVNNVQERMTVLEVTRGMVERYIKGVNVIFPGSPKPKLVSYFKIVATELPTNASANNKDFLKDWKTDLDIFSFFIQRRQFVDNQTLL